MASEQITKQRGLRARDAARYCGLGRSTFLRYVSEGRAPAPKKLSPGSVIWLRDQLDSWMESAEQAQ